MEGSIFTEVMEKAMTTDNREEGDYIGPDGLLMCGKCHTPKQFRNDVEGMFYGRISPMACECVRMEREEQDRAFQRRQTLEQIDRYRKQGLCEAQYMESTFANDDGADQEASITCRKYADMWEEMKAKNLGLMLWGDVGGGKTFLASCIANALIDRAVPVLMSTIPALSSAMYENWESNKRSILDSIKTVPLLIIDDFGIERGTATAVERAYEIINARYKAKKPMIVTTNLSMEAMKNAEDANYRRIYDRVIERCVPVKLKASNRRKETARKNMEEMKRLFDGI